MEGDGAEGSLASGLAPRLTRPRPAPQKALSAFGNRMGRKREMKRSKVTEIVIYASLCAVGVLLIHPSLELGLGSSRELGPGLLPFVVSLVVVAAGIALIVLTFLRRAPGPVPSPEDAFGRKGWLRVLIVLASLAGWPLLSSAVGYVIPTFLVSLCIAKVTGYQGWRGPITLSAGIGLGTWVLFSRLFSTDLPAGFFF